MSSSKQLLKILKEVGILITVELKQYSKKLAKSKVK